MQLRLDVAERVAGELGYETRRGAMVLPARPRFAAVGEGRELLPIILR